MRWFLLVLNAFSDVYTVFLLWLNRHQRVMPLPDNISDVYDKEEYQRWQQYEDETDRFSMISHLMNLICMAFFILSPYYGWLSSLLPQNILLNSILMVMVTYSIEMIIQIPFNYYHVFVIEEKYQMNTMTLRLFIIDLLKDTFMNIGIIVILFLFIHYFSLWFGYMGFIILFIVLVIIYTFIQRYPLLLMRLFNQFTPLDEGDLKDRLTQLVYKYGFELKGIYVMDASKRTKRANAFCTGVGKKKEISLDDNMLEQYSEDEILAVFAHEFGHAILKHTEKLKWLTFGQLVIMFCVFLFVIMNEWLYADFGIYQLNYFMVMIVLSIFLIPVFKVMSILSNYYSRRFEYEADAFAVRQGYGAALKILLKKLSRDDLTNIYPHPLVVKLNYSHPPLSQRILAIEKERKNDKRYK